MEVTKEFRNQVYKIMLDLIKQRIADTDNSYRYNRSNGLCSYLTNAVNKTDTNEYTQIDIKSNTSVDVDLDISGRYDGNTLIWTYLDDITLYPELIKHKPDNNDAYWFDCDNKGAAKHVSILEEAIKDTDLPMCPACGTHDISADEDGHFTCNKCE